MRVKQHADIGSPVDREIAQLMDAGDVSKTYGERAGRAYARAAADGGQSENAFRRELQRAKEEEEFLMLSAMLLFKR